MFKWPMLAATAAVAIELQAGAGAAQRPIETIFAIPSQTLTFATHYVAHDAGFFQKEGSLTTIGGLDAEKDVRVAPMDPPAMLPALESKAVDGDVMSRFTTQAVVKGVAVTLASSTFDAPELHRFESSQKVSLVATPFDPKVALTSYDDLFADEFVGQTARRRAARPSENGAAAPAVAL
jgi:ABC-type nitrate/sulfonate/bicarbonate transport system substrate-binding protein